MSTYGQRRLVSFIETVTNTAIGYVGSLCIWMTLSYFHVFGIHTSFAESNGVTMIFTVWSVVRGYTLRRFFNHFHDWLNKVVGGNKQ